MSASSNQHVQGMTESATVPGTESHHSHLAGAERDHLGSVALDQWRGLALVFVLISHGFYFTGRVHGIGRVGVNLFFFISGVLVFRSLSRTRVTGGWARTRSFWWRRFRRIYPALISYVIAGAGVTWWLADQPFLPMYSDLGTYLRSMPAALAYLSNYVIAGPLALGHLWSLACEMQFYFVAPIIYILGGKTEGRRNAVFGTVLAVLLGFGMAQPFLGIGKYEFQFAVWPMMLGFCCEYRRGWFQKIPRHIATILVWGGVIVCGITMVLMVLGVASKPMMVATGALLLAPCWLCYLFGRPMPAFPGTWAKWIGERTYSIYLWQQPFTICSFIPQMLHPLGAAVSVLVGGAWFRVFEQPFLSASRRRDTSPVSLQTRSRLSRLVTVAAVCLLVSLCVAWIFRTRYEHQLRERLWPASKPLLSVQSAPASEGKEVVLLLGDSRMAQWGLPDLGNCQIVNAGTGKLTTGQIRLAAPEVIEKFRPGLVVLEAGINDLKYAGLRPEVAPPIVSLASSNIAAIVEACVERGCRVLILDTWPAGKPSLMRRLVWSRAINRATVQLNAELHKLASPARHVAVVDLFEAANLKPGAELYLDTLHFEARTYQSLTPALKSRIESILADASPRRGTGYE